MPGRISYSPLKASTIGGLLPFLFSAMTMRAVGAAANKMVDEIRRQFREIPGLLEGAGTPDTARCVDIATSAALKKMVIPGVIAVAAPPVIGFGIGPEALGGMLGEGQTSVGMRVQIDHLQPTPIGAEVAAAGRVPARQQSATVAMAPPTIGTTA